MRRAIALAIASMLLTGQELRAASPPEKIRHPRRVATTRGAEPTAAPAPTARKNQVSVSLTFSLDFYYPSVSYERVIAPELTLGATILYTSGLDTGARARFRGVGGGVSLNWYPDQGFLRPWGKLGLLLTSVSATTPTAAESKTAHGFVAIAGIAVPTDVHVIFRAGLGLQAFSSPFAVAPWPLRGVSPLVHFDFAYPW